MKQLKSFFNFIVTYNFLIALSAITLCFQTQVSTLNTIVLSPYLLLLFCGSLFDYNLHRLMKFKFHQESHIDKHKYNEIYPVIWLSFIGIFICLFQIPIKLYSSLFLIGLLTLSYTLPFIFKNKYLNQIKRIPYLKMGMIAFVWSFLTVNIPIENLNINLSSRDLMLLFLSRFFFISAISIPFDIRDKETDLKDGVRTIAHSLSKKKIRIVIYILIVLMNVCIYHFGQNRQMPMLILPYIISSIFSIYVINSKSIQKQKYYYQLYVDGMLILQFILVYIFIRLMN